MYYHAEIGRSSSNHVGVSRRLPQNFGNAALRLRPLQFGGALPLRCYHGKFGRSGWHE